MEKTTFKHEKPQSKEFEGISRRINEALVEGKKQKSLVTIKPTSLQGMEEAKLHLFADDNGVPKLQVKFGGRLYNLTLTGA